MFGYELLEPKPMPKDFLPIWWPKYPEGAPIRYVYRLIDGDGGMDVNFKMSKVVRKVFRKDRPVSFLSLAAKEASFTHISTEYNNRRPQDRPFLSASLDLEAAYQPMLFSYLPKGYEPHVVK